MLESSSGHFKLSDNTRLARFAMVPARPDVQDLKILKTQRYAQASKSRKTDAERNHIIAAYCLCPYCKVG